MSEKASRRTLIQATPTLDPWPIESPLTGPGVPDYFCITSVVEIKCLKRWPVRPTTPVSLEHPLTEDQYRWLRRRWQACGPAFVLLQANRLEWLLFAAPDSGVLRHKHTVTREELYKRCLVRWTKGLPSREITHWLSRTWQDLEDRRAWVKGTWAAGNVVRESFEQYV